MEGFSLFDRKKGFWSLLSLAAVFFLFSLSRILSALLAGRGVLYGFVAYFLPYLGVIAAFWNLTRICSVKSPKKEIKPSVATVFSAAAMALLFILNLTLNKADAKTSAEGFDLFTEAVEYVLIAPAAEEFLFRRMVFTYFSRDSLLLAYIGTAVLFALMHGDVRGMILAFPASIALSFAYRYSGKLIYPICLHFLYNFLTFIFVNFLL